MYFIFFINYLIIIYVFLYSCTDNDDFAPNRCVNPDTTLQGLFRVCTFFITSVNMIEK
jgi:hypothetical protein